ncbi:MAG: transcription antitermination factor NusB [Candidatus Zambryskibacteria bacterium RIFCSPLOWO2_12_FULL_39_45]|uniref:Transcription antitermination protein NusB n=2 Tax=Candidatus Zambryskiibacteriota TaxID=1817925 RepID=A0A1G2TK48_9BACT|nr:MAG: N utilization substance protein B-like protein [Parcubacteria group bacterium GW2011_GWA2_40_14]OHA97680.1 MAG: transcription antitermination factor NusB [Candidatus Zambryskibacteria bacterium RIFCSPHIGHO2_12_FULL_38_37]OHB08571.1 MAG: transcription antitermination factor NusB [Candidatus Zambryskibacteria bacterium RIFCSPLOWO2_02_39_10]OHB09996.1 MAG: transcription antitermination factor NusB [Candidatus Zambryskibacteria bacterium RIFCSPLOWO2_02_FULL_39_69]OHB13509.1 MAG: transcripti
MANRHLSRSIVLQSLFEWDFGSKSSFDAISIFKRNAEEFAPGLSDFSFMDTLLKGVLEKQKDVDLIIEKAAPDWPIDKISVIDRNILRIGLYELLFSDRSQVPPKVAINEAIELSKTFGGDTSSKFVNGVLGAVYKELGEPGKDETGKDKKNNGSGNLPVPVFYLGGAVVYAKDGDDIYLALVHDVFGRWTLSKGKIEENEDVEVGTIREIKEELGLDIKIKEKLGENEYVAYNPEKGKIKKHVVYFLAESKFVDLTPEAKGGLDDAKWFKMGDILDLNFYNDILPLVTKAINILLKK